MTCWGTQAIESYDLLQLAVPVACYICDGENHFDAEFCRHCRAPLALAYQVRMQGKKPHLIGVIGMPGAGKTVYLGMLTDILSRQEGPLQILARGAFSVSLQQRTMAALARRQFPPATPVDPDGWNWVHCEVCRAPKRRNVELVLPDVAGRAFTREIEHPNRYPIIRTFLAKCAGAVVLVDAERLEQGDQEQDFQAMKLVTYLTELNNGRKKNWASRPLALVFSKADTSQDVWSDPDRYAQQHTPGLWRHCQQRLDRHAFFCTSVVGASVRAYAHGESVTLPLRVEPRGVTQPFEWLVEQLGKNERLGA